MFILAKQSTQENRDYVTAYRNKTEKPQLRKLETRYCYLIHLKKQEISKNCTTTSMISMRFCKSFLTATIFTHPNDLNYYAVAYSETETLYIRADHREPTDIPAWYII